MRQIAFRILTTDGHRWTQILQEAAEPVEGATKEGDACGNILTRRERKAESRGGKVANQDVNHRWRLMDPDSQGERATGKRIRQKNWRQKNEGWEGDFAFTSCLQFLFRRTSKLAEISGSFSVRFLPQF